MLPVFNIVIVNETFTTGILAQQMSERLAANLEAEFETEIVFWGFDEMLWHPQLWERATCEISEADMVIVAARDAGELPAQIVAWIEGWRPQNHDGAAVLVALFDREPESSSPPTAACVFLRQIAEKTDREFFCKTSDWRPQDFELSVETTLRHPGKASGSHGGSHAPGFRLARLRVNG